METAWEELPGWGNSCWGDYPRLEGAAKEGVDTAECEEPGIRRRRAPAHLDGQEEGALRTECASEITWHVGNADREGEPLADPTEAAGHAMLMN